MRAQLQTDTLGSKKNYMTLVKGNVHRWAGEESSSK